MIKECHLTPLFILLFPSFVSLQFNNELVHYVMLFLVDRVSLFALNTGFKNHKKLSFYFLGLVGLILLIMALLIGEKIMGEFGEKIIKLIGSIILSIAHFKNY